MTDPAEIPYELLRLAEGYTDAWCSGDPARGLLLRGGRRAQRQWPKAEFFYAFPGADTKDECGVPVVVGKFWVQTDHSLPGLIALDVGDPAKPVEVSRLVFDARFSKPHWVAADRRSDRLVVTGNGRSWVLVVSLDPKTGKLTLDENWKMKHAGGSGIDFDRPVWPHGAGGEGLRARRSVRPCLTLVKDMKRRPGRKRGERDDSLLFCLEDGAALFQGSVPAPDEPRMAILHQGSKFSPRLRRVFR